jgi:hypothetical protein
MQCQGNISFMARQARGGLQGGLRSADRQGRLKPAPQGLNIYEADH